MAIYNIITVYAVPFFVLVILATGYFRGVKLYESFLKGAKEGLETTLRIIPVLIAMFIAIGAIRQSGVLDALTRLFSVFNLSGVPPEIYGLAFLRPFSGSGSLALVSEIIKTHGVDTFPGLLASTMQGTTETTLYVLSVYFGAIGVTRLRHCVITGLVADLFSFIFAFLLCRLFFG